MTPDHDPPRPALPPARDVLRAGAALLLTVFSLGCAGDASSAQESARVPSDIETVRERADRARVKGDTTAPIRMVEISDFECPFCAQYYSETYGALDSLYIETGKVEYVFITYPSAGHPRAWPAAEAAHCAGATGRFWQMHDLLFERQDSWKTATEPTRVFRGYAREIGIDGESFAACLEEDRAAPLMVRDLEQISRAGISSTPFFIVDNEVSLQGAAPLDRFRSVLDSALQARQSGGSGEPGGS